MPPRLIEQATDKILSILYDMTSEKFPLSGRGLNRYLFQYLKTHLYSVEISEHPLVLFHTQGLQPGVYGDVFTGHHLLPLQDNSTKEKTKIQSNFVIPNHFYKIETEFFKCFLSKTILGKKSDKLCSYQIVLKKRSQNRSKAALQDNDSVKFKFVYAL